MTKRMLVLVVMAMLVAGCSVTRGSGIAISDERTVDDFDSIEVSGSVEVEVAVGPAAAVVVEGDDNIVEIIRTRVRDRRLVIDTEPGRSYLTSEPLIVRATTPSLVGIEVSGSADVMAAGVEAPTLTLEVSGSGSIRPVGAAGTLEIDVSGSGSVDGASLDVTDAEVEVSGSGSVIVSVSGALRANVSGSGTVEYLGDPTVDSDVSGSGSVKRAS